MKCNILKTNPIKVKPLVLVITGLPGTGKSTLAGALAGDLGMVHLNTDMIRDEMGLRGRYDPKTKKAVYDQMRQRAARKLAAGQNVLIDGTFYLESLRDSFQQLAVGAGGHIRWIELKAEEATIRDRVKNKRAFSEADYDVYKKIKALYEPLNRPHLVLWSDELSLEEQVRRAKDFLMLPA